MVAERRPPAAADERPHLVIERLMVARQVRQRRHQDGGHVVRPEARAIADVHRTGMIADASAGALTIGLAVVLVVVALRVLKTQRQLTEQYIALLAERNRAQQRLADLTSDHIISTNGEKWTDRDIPR